MKIQFGRMTFDIVFLILILILYFWNWDDNYNSNNINEKFPPRETEIEYSILNADKSPIQPDNNLEEDLIWILNFLNFSNDIYTYELNGLNLKSVNNYENLLGKKVIVKVKWKSDLKRNFFIMRNPILISEENIL